MGTGVDSKTGKTRRNSKQEHKTKDGDRTEGVFDRRPDSNLISLVSSGKSFPSPRTSLLKQ